MIGKIMKNNSFRATSRYVLEKKEAELIGGNLFGCSMDEMVMEFMMSKSLNPDIERPVYHLTQSYSYADKETGKLTEERLADLATRHLAGMIVSASEPELLEDAEAFTRRVYRFLQEEIHSYQFFIAVHKDQEHIHTHLVASRINLLDTKCVPTWYERIRTQKVCRILEKQFGLEQLQNSGDINKPDQATRHLIMQTAPIMAELLNQREGKPMKTEKGELTRQGKTITYQRADGTIALKAYQNRKENWTARSGDLSPQELKPWQQLKKEQAQYQAKADQRHAEEQNNYKDYLAPIIQEIWIRETAGRPKPETATFGDYVIGVNQSGQPELFKRDIKVMGWADGKCESYGLTEEDIKAVNRFNALSVERTKERRQEQQFNEREQERKQERDRQKQKGRGIDR